MNRDQSTEHQQSKDSNEHPRRVSLFDRYQGFAPTLPGISSGSALVEWYRSLFRALSTLRTLGAGFTLSVVVSTPTDGPNSAHFNNSTVKNWAAVSSILFVLTVLVCQGCSQLFKFEQDIIADGLNRNNPCIKWPLAGLSLLLQGQVLGAFRFLELVLTAYAPKVGWVGIGITCWLAVIAFLLWPLQATGRRPVAQYLTRTRTKVDNEANASFEESTSSAKLQEEDA